MGTSRVSAHVQILLPQGLLQSSPPGPQAEIACAASLPELLSYTLPRPTEPGTSRPGGPGQLGTHWELQPLCLEARRGTGHLSHSGKHCCRCGNRCLHCLKCLLESLVSERLLISCKCVFSDLLCSLSCGEFSLLPSQDQTHLKRIGSVQCVRTML
jgi:hypothetical protein